MTDQEKEAKVAALVKERAGYVVHGRSDRVAQVDAELKRLGVSASVPVKRASKRTQEAK